MDDDLDKMIQGIYDKLGIPKDYLYQLVREFDPSLLDRRIIDGPTKPKPRPRYWTNCPRCSMANRANDLVD